MKKTHTHTHSISVCNKRMANRLRIQRDMRIPSLTLNSDGSIVCVYACPFLFFFISLGVAYRWIHAILLKCSNINYRVDYRFWGRLCCSQPKFLPKLRLKTLNIYDKIVCAPNLWCMSLENLIIAQFVDALSLSTSWLPIMTLKLWMRLWNHTIMRSITIILILRLLLRFIGQIIEYHFLAGHQNRWQWLNDWFTRIIDLRKSWWSLTSN